jgi:hypothetical protein
MEKMIVKENAQEKEVPEGDGRSLADEEGVMPMDEEDVIVEAPVLQTDEVLEYDVALPEDILEYETEIRSDTPEEEVPQGIGRSLVEEEGVMPSDEGVVEAPVEPADDILEYDVTLPEDILEYDISLAAPASKGYEIEPPHAPLSPALKESPKLLYQPPGFFRSHRRLNI